MIKKSIFLLSIVFYTFFCGKAYPQEKGIYNEKFKDKVEQNVREFYKNAPQFTTNEYMAFYFEKLSRISVKTKPITEGENYTLLSSLVLLNKYNPDLKRDDSRTFDPESFNALKYNFNFFPKQEVIYRVDNTPYIIVIYPQET